MEKKKGKGEKEGKPKEIFKRKKELVEIGLESPFTIKLRESLMSKGIPLEEV
ncbi:hypothetical protein ACEF17_12330 [Streptococcus hyovaginalis]